MSQINISPGGGTTTTDRSGEGFGMGMIIALLMGILILAAVAWWTFTQSGWFGPTPGGTTNVSITQNLPPAGTTGGAGSTGGTGATTGGQPAAPAVR
jgi:hypothetical protein